MVTSTEHPDYQALAEFRYQMRRFLHLSEETARAAGIEPQQHQLMLAVKGIPDGEEPRIAYLAERLQIQHHSAVELADRMEKKSLIIRMRAESDRREVHVQLTTRGERVLAELTKHHRLIRYDERGNGLSQWDVPEMSFDLWVQDLETVVEAAGVDRFALLGISQGGAVAIAYAIRHPERVSHLILLGAFSQGLAARGTEEQMAARRALQTLVRMGWGKNNPDFKSMYTKFYFPHASTPEQLDWFNDLQRISASPENAARILTLIDEISVRALLPQVSVPTIVFHGDRDRVIPAEEGRILASEIPGARFIPLNTANHVPLAEEPAWGVFLEELGAFLGWQNATAESMV